MQRRTFLILVFVLVLFAGRGNAQQSKFKYRWIYVQTNLLTDSEAERVQALMKRGAAAGYNGLVLADYKADILDRVYEHYFKNADAVRKTAQDLHMKFIVTTSSIGYSSGLLAHDPNLAEGMPVRDAAFAAHSGQAELVPAAAAHLTNGDFEDANNNKFAGYGYQDDIGQTTFADTETKHGGKQSLRIENILKAHPDSGNARVIQSVALIPFRQYHISVWLKTQDFETPGSIRGMVLAGEGHALDYIDWPVARTQDWTQYHIVFNSQKYDRASVYFGTWGGRNGKLWFDDAKLEEVGLLNVLRRSGCPLTVKGEDGTVYTYTEGTDYAPIADPKMGNVPWAGGYEIYHAPPAIKLTANSRIKEGQKLRVSFYHSATTMTEQVSCCLSDPHVYDILKDQARRVRETYHPDGFFMSHDEMRNANWCWDCLKRNLTPGQLLADNLTRCTALLRAADPKAELFVWSDMFDPNHNAVDDYYLVNGSLKGSWNGLAKDVTVVNWNQNKAASVRWFAERGNPQILAGYYDADPNAIKDWLAMSKGLQGVVGVMYTTWGQHFDALEAFAKAAWGQ